jgi:hypothetical protein
VHTQSRLKEEKEKKPLSLFPFLKKRKKERRRERREEKREERRGERRREGTLSLCCTFNYGGCFFPSSSPPSPGLLAIVHLVGVLPEWVLQPKQLLRCVPLYSVHGVPEHWSM